MSNDGVEYLLQELISLFKPPKKPEPYVKSREAVDIPSSSYELPTSFQAPLKVTYFNSGDYSPNKPTDPRHTQGHKGVDLRAPGGSSVYPIADNGKVTNVLSLPNGGNTVYISYNNGAVKTYYAHLGTVRVHKGQDVDTETVVGTVGDSGNAKGTAPHIHVETWKNNQLVNPGTLFYVPKYTNIDRSKEKLWLSEDHKEEAKNFDIKKHIDYGKQVFSLKCDKLVKIATLYENLDI